jgi:hypothetical protein
MSADILNLTAASRRAIERFEMAKASGSPNAIGSARVELGLIKGRLEAARAEIVARDEIAKALRTPVRPVR